MLRAGFHPRYVRCGIWEERTDSGRLAYYEYRDSEAWRPRGDTSRSTRVAVVVLHNETRILGLFSYTFFSCR